MSWIRNVWNSYVDFVGGWIGKEAEFCRVAENRSRGHIGTYYKACVSADGLTHVEADAKLASKIARQNVMETTYPKKQTEGFWFCFTGDTFLLKEDGSLTTFGEIAGLPASGLPTLASYDESASSIVYQRPTAVINHGVVNTELLYLGIQDGIGNIAPLKVTPNHPLLAERGGAKFWTEAGQIADGESLVGEGGPFSFDKAGTITIKGAFDLYDLTFATPGGELHPTFLVSPDGQSWFVAHNKMY